MLSRFLRTRERDGMVVLFHDLHPRPVYCSAKVWNNVSPDGIAHTEEEARLFEALREEGLIIQDTGEDDREFEKTFTTLKNKFNNPSILYLMTAQGCNLSCNYCPVPDIAQKYGDTRLSISDAKAGIDLWMHHLNEVDVEGHEYYVIFYGGEPLLNKNTIEASLAYLRELETLRKLPAVNKMVVTNGLLLDTNFARILSDYNVSVVLGIDGPQKLHDQMRIDSEKKGSYQQVIKAVKILRDHNVHTFASVSITPLNIEFIDTYRNFFKEIGIEKFGFNFVRGKKLLEVLAKDELPQFYKKLARVIIDSYKNFPEERFEYQMEKKLLAFQGDYFPVDCTCYGNQLVIQPDGQISNCPFRKTLLGHVQAVGEGFRINEQEFVKFLKQRLPLYNKRFDGLEEKTLYGGGCSWACEETSGDPLADDECSLTFTKEVFDELIWAACPK